MPCGSAAIRDMAKRCSTVRTELSAARCPLSPVVRVAPGRDCGQGVRQNYSQAGVILRLVVLSRSLPEGFVAVPRSQRVVGQSDATCAHFARRGRLICTMLAAFHRQTHPCSFSLLDMGRGSWLAVMIPVSSPPQVRGAKRRCGQCVPARCGQGMTDRRGALELP